jgi:hypothetical protein
VVRAKNRLSLGTQVIKKIELISRETACFRLVWCVTSISHRTDANQYSEITARKQVRARTRCIFSCRSRSLFESSFSSSLVNLHLIKCVALHPLRVCMCGVNSFFMPAAFTLAIFIYSRAQWVRKLN